MKNKIKYLFIGLIFGFLISSTPVLADSLMQNIDVIFNTVQVQIDGENIDATNILYDGTTYLPMRKVAELGMFDKGFVLDESKFHARHYVYNGDLPFEEIRILIHAQSDEFLESFANRAISEHYDNELYEAGDGLVITLGYSYFEGENYVLL